jgi:radical SAM-linked protein
VADFRLRIGFAESGPARFLSHLELVRAMERCVRRSGLPYAVSQGFNPHMKHSFSAALPVGTGSRGEYMDVELAQLVEPGLALCVLREAEHENLPIQSAAYVAKDAPSLQVYFNLASYLIELEDSGGTLLPALLERLQDCHEVEVLKKGKPKRYDLSLYVMGFAAAAEKPASPPTLSLSLLSRPEGSLRPEVILEALTPPSHALTLTTLTRVALEHQE